jgi:hypothetical protein
VKEPADLAKRIQCPGRPRDRMQPSGRPSSLAEFRSWRNLKWVRFPSEFLQWVNCVRASDSWRNIGLANTGISMFKAEGSQATSMLLVPCGDERKNRRALLKASECDDNHVIFVRLRCQQTAYHQTPPRWLKIVTVVTWTWGFSPTRVCQNSHPPMQSFLCGLLRRRPSVPNPI